MKQFVFSLVLVFSMGSLFAQSAAEEAAAQDNSIVIKPCSDKQGKCFYRKDKLNGRKTIFTLVEYDEVTGKFIEPNLNSNEKISFKIIEESNNNVKESKRKAKEKALKNKKKKGNRAVKGLKKEIKS